MKIHNIAGWIVGLALLIYGQRWIPESGCVDGWESPSIGSRGACSHHGGVSSAGAWAEILLLGASFVSGVLVTNKLNPNAKEELEEWQRRQREREPKKRWYTGKDGRRRTYWK